MNFSLNDTQAMLVDSVQKFIANDYDFERRMAASGSDTAYSTDVWQQMCDLGWTLVTLPEADGGLGGGHVDLALLMEQFGRGLVVEPYLANVVMAGGVLLRVGTAEQRERWLMPVLGGDKQAALAFTEPQSRYMLSAVATRAERHADGWHLQGQKSVVLNGGNADTLVVLARTEGDAVDESGLSLFVVDANDPGVARRSYPTVDGAQAAEISLDVALADDALLGDAGQAYAPFAATIDDATLAVGAEAVGILRTLTEKTVEYSKSRKQFGVPIGAFQALQHRMVDMLTHCEQAYSLMLRAAMSRDAQRASATRDIAALKFYVATAGQKTGEEAVQLHGGMGVTWELDVAHYFKRLTVINQIFGNGDTHLDRLART